VNCSKCSAPLGKTGPSNHKTGLCRVCYDLYRPQGSKADNFKGGLQKQANGYIRYYPEGCGGKQGRRPYVLYHRFVWEQAFGKLPLGWQVHHLNGDKSDNRLENLKAMPVKEHYSLSWVIALQDRILKLEEQLSHK